MRQAGAWVTAVGAALGCLVAAEPACACSCLPISRETALVEADVVFVGRPVQRIGPADPLSPENVVYVFAVDSVVKGAPPRKRHHRVATSGNEASCGISFQLGARYEVFASGPAGELVATLCGGTRRLSPPAPGPGSESDVDSADPDDPGSPDGPVKAGVGAAARWPADLPADQPAAQARPWSESRNRP